MSLLTIAEVLSGETLVSPGGPVDRLTAAADDIALWQLEGIDFASARSRAEEELVLA
jgi:hypothetical protein